ncbi:MAG: hypothetical protein ACRECV_12350 [Xanthobacteraceae bacterium]
MAELEYQLDSAREELSRRQNEVHSLEESLHLSVGENANLLDRLSKITLTVDEKSVQLDQTRSALKAAEAERERADRRHSEQLAALNVEFEATTARAAKAEQLFADAQQTLLGYSFENSAAQRQIVGLNTSLQEKEWQLQDNARRLRENERQLQGKEWQLQEHERRLQENERLLQDKERQLQENQRQLAVLDVAQADLIAGAKSRDAVLGRAEERLRSLAELFVQIEAKTRGLTSGSETANGGRPLSGAQLRAGAANDIAAAVRSSCAILRRDLENDAWLFGGRDTLRVA